MKLLASQDLPEGTIVENDGEPTVVNSRKVQPIRSLPLACTSSTSPILVKPIGIVCIDGVKKGDVIGRESLALSCSADAP